VSRLKKKRMRERERENSSREEKGEVKRIQSLPPRKDPRPPFYKTRGQVS
jgi:hypothetical protein